MLSSGIYYTRIRMYTSIAIVANGHINEITHRGKAACMRIVYSRKFLLSKIFVTRPLNLT